MLFGLAVEANVLPGSVVSRARVGAALHHDADALAAANALHHRAASAQVKPRPGGVV